MRRLAMMAAVLAGLAPAFAAPAARAADPSRGADLFDENCAECHSVAPALRNKKGPSLFGVVGRKVASVPGFTYTPSLAGTGIVWSAATLDAYLANPKKVAPEGKMKFDGFAKPGDRADVIAFLAKQR